MKILAIRFARLGDVILLLPALARLKGVFPDAHLTFLTGHRCAPVAELCPAIDDIISVDRVAMRDGSVLSALSGIRSLVADVRRRKFDLVIDFHGFRETNLLTWLSNAPRRLGLQRFDQSFLKFCFNLPPVREDKALHVSDMFLKVVDALGSPTRSPGPSLRIPEQDVLWARQQTSVRAGERTVVLYVDAPVHERIWPAERFAAIGDRAVDEFNARVVVIAGPNGDPLIRRVIDASKRKQNFQGFAGISIGHAAALVAGASLVVSNDTGPMHLGPALGIATLGIFSVGLPEHFAPKGVSQGYVRGEPIEKVTVAEVWAAAAQLWVTAAGRGPQR